MISTYCVEITVIQCCVVIGTCSKPDILSAVPYAASPVAADRRCGIALLLISIRIQAKDSVVAVLFAIVFLKIVDQPDVFQFFFGVVVLML